MSYLALFRYINEFGSHRTINTVPASFAPTAATVGQGAVSRGSQGLPFPLLHLSLRQVARATSQY
ncbi:uncharacterized protein CANTADRAFT_26400 [Suhomyces tanzawaensis NRRL Y-17324]|uniref:Uncharacterized protein n=1 Tax=Suhomyces tanzawaensis NRRL Y-17324 TaxID=984487 RepID=A0A1E4SJ23_9ASCO|nr:uncharacterized protein CANTADRAFT_26400 [Suhomyces tanzawaensis NRRL Y-17324]ODV79501.1 hypothetical protein CANTADRAFT_26400 [Suhomyces tanzawaensis NRRL Y-17324]